MARILGQTDVSIRGKKMNTKMASTTAFTLANLKPVGGIPLLLNVEASGMNATARAEEHQGDVRVLL
jgi:hypothetical protein